eukprot:TRINITY_DN3983_c0_g1_i1.p1 TRINITY_DN3983_c0_g1~~TRINITY_DN3983_c0_g1_i1.p1  ORF type:complete len:112 (+),score=1.80 TRINITY_DN3983_c0_g1_i1:262-597(+)
MVSAFVTFWSVCLTGSAISGWQNSCQVNPPSGYDTFYTTVSCLFATVVIFYNSLHYLVAQQNPEVAVVTQSKKMNFSFLIGTITIIFCFPYSPKLTTLVRVEYKWHLLLPV